MSAIYYRDFSAIVYWNICLDDTRRHFDLYLNIPHGQSGTITITAKALWFWGVVLLSFGSVLARYWLVVIIIIPSNVLVIITY